LSVASPASTANVTVFNQQDISRLSAVNDAIQSLKQDVTVSLKTLSPHEVEKIQSFAFIEMSLEAIQERATTVFFLVLVTTQMETWNDQARILNALYGEVLPKAETYVTAKQRGIVNIATAHAGDNMFASYSNRAASVVEDQLVPVLDQFYQRLASIHK
jgi:hypothetical protein